MPINNSDTPGWLVFFTVMGSRGLRSLQWPSRASAVLCCGSKPQLLPMLLESLTISAYLIFSVISHDPLLVLYPMVQAPPCLLLPSQ